MKKFIKQNESTDSLFFATFSFENWLIKKANKKPERFVLELDSNITNVSRRDTSSTKEDQHEARLHNPFFKLSNCRQWSEKIVRSSSLEVNLHRAPQL